MKKELTINDKVVLNDVELIIFDKDGTLIDIHHYWGLMIKTRSELIIKSFFPNSSKKKEIDSILVGSMGLDTKTNKLKKEGPIGIKPRKYIVQVVTEVINKYDANKNSEDVERLFKIVDKQTEIDIKPFLKILPGVQSFLEECQKNHIQLAIATVDISDRVKVALKELNLYNYFHYIIGSDLVTNSKPAPDTVNNIMDECKIPIGKTAVVGDHLVDIQMGINAGVPCNIGVATGLCSISELKALPCFAIENFSQLGIN